jgi:hypothetical protein
MKKKPLIGAQPMINGAAYQLGIQCPIGKEVELLIGLQTLFPELPFSEARNSFWAGLADRYIPEEQREPRYWDGKSAA